MKKLVFLNVSKKQGIGKFIPIPSLIHAFANMMVKKSDWFQKSAWVHVVAFCSTCVLLLHCCFLSNSLVFLNYSMVAFSLNSFGLLWWIWVTKKSSSTRVGLPREFMKFVRSQSKSPYDYKLALKFCRRPLSKLLGSIQILVFTYFFQCIYVVVWPK